MSELQEDDKRRKPNFSTLEVTVLLQEYKANKHILQGSFTNTITNKVRNQCWNKIADQVNEVGETQRTGLDVKKKFQDFRIVVKKKRSAEIKHQKGTGN